MQDNQSQLKQAVPYRAFVKFRQDLRQLLYDFNVPSNPGWTEDDIVHALRKLVSDLSLRIHSRTIEELEIHHGSQRLSFEGWRTLVEHLLGFTVRGDEPLDMYRSGLSPEGYAKKITAKDPFATMADRADSFVSTEARVVPGDDRWGCAN